MLESFEVLEGLASAPGIIVSVVGSDGTLKYISKNITICLGYDVDEMINTKSYDHSLLLSSGSCDDKVYYRNHKNGSQICMERVIQNKCGGEGNTTYMERVVEETTIECAEVKLKSSSLTSKKIFSPTQVTSHVPRHILEDFVENGAMALKMVDADGDIVWANTAEMKVLGFTPEEYIGNQDLWEIVIVNIQIPLFCLWLLTHTTKNI
jgi:PAS domain-containing protein